MNTLCIFHGGCTDGVAAAWAVWKRYPDCTFYPGVYQRDPPWVLIEAAAQVVLVDFSYKRDVVEEIARRARGRVLILDHHKAAQADLESLLVGTVDGDFDMGRCGALMAWDHFHPAETRPDLLSIIDAQDRWLPERDPEMIMALRSYPHYPVDDSAEAWVSLMRQWTWLMSREGFSELRKEGSGLMRPSRTPRR